MKKFLIGIGIVLLVLVMAVISLPFLVNANEFRPRLESELTTALGRDVKVGELKLNILGGTVSADAGLASTSRARTRIACARLKRVERLFR